MHRRTLLPTMALCLSLPLVACEPGSPAPSTVGNAELPGIPEPLRAEHAEIHAGLAAATQMAGSAGEAARALEDVLAPHFLREEQIALPPLGLLAPLARGEFNPSMTSVLPMTDSLAAELPGMLREHEVIDAAAARLEEVARTEGVVEVERLAAALRAHARSEEEILYPAAVLVGEIVRRRAGQPD
jgi:hypothetical protein